MASVNLFVQAVPSGCEQLGSGSRTGKRCGVAQCDNKPCIASRHIAFAAASSPCGLSLVVFSAGMHSLGSGGRAPTTCENQSRSRRFFIGTLIAKNGSSLMVWVATTPWHTAPKMPPIPALSPQVGPLLYSSLDVPLHVVWRCSCNDIRSEILPAHCDAWCW